MRAPIRFLILTAFVVIIPLSAAQELRADVRDAKPGTSGIPPTGALTPEARGDIFMARKMYREAIETYLTVQPPNAIILNKVGIANHQMSNLDTAKKYYERSLKVTPKYAEAMNNLGTIHYAKKNYRKAISCYKKALVLTPKSASIYSNLGTAYFARRNYKQAFEAYEVALQLDPEVFEHRSTAGVLLQERSVTERAKFHFYLAKTYAKAGQTDRALLYIRKSLEEGFKEKTKYLEDGDFAELRKLPEFGELMKLEPRVL